MVRNISSNALTTLAQRLGNEPITIVEVDWADGVVPRLYADRTISTAAGMIPGAIVEVGDWTTPLTSRSRTTPRSKSA